MQRQEAQVRVSKYVRTTCLLLVTATIGCANADSREIDRCSYQYRRDGLISAIRSLYGERWSQSPNRIVYVAFNGNARPRYFPWGPFTYEGDCEDSDSGSQRCRYQIVITAEATRESDVASLAEVIIPPDGRPAIVDYYSLDWTSQGRWELRFSARTENGVRQATWERGM